jgi:phosphopantothenoylcysteine decarboxylase/phosphopantothenate--cysteine ligase
MGLALARAAVDRGHPTTLLLGPVDVKPSPMEGLTLHRFETTADLQALLREHWPAADLLLMAAAVADFIPRPLAPPGAKASRLDGCTQVHLDPAPDLLHAMATQRRPGQVLVGFALEAGAHRLEKAAAKLKRKGIDAIVANPLDTMDAPDILGSLLLADGEILSPSSVMAKDAFARWLLDQLERAFPCTGPVACPPSV